GNERGDPIVVVQKANTAGINFALTKGSSISGKVTDSVTNAPLPNVGVRVFDSKENPVSYGLTTQGGVYKAQGLASGKYYVIAEGWKYLTALYNQLDCSEECHVTSGTPVIVNVGQDATDIDFSMIPSNFIFGDDFVDPNISSTWT